MNYKLNIPLIKLAWRDGIKLVNNIDKLIHLKIDLGLAAPDNRVEYELRYSSILDLTKD